MAKGTLHHIASYFKEFTHQVLLVENNDRFLYRNDVIESFASMGIEICKENSIGQRIKYELREPGELLILLSQDNSTYLEDIKKNASLVEWSLDAILPGYHIPSVIDVELPVLDRLLDDQPWIRLKKQDTLKRVEEIRSTIEKKPEDQFDIHAFDVQLNTLLNERVINWSVVSRFIAKGMLQTIGTPLFVSLQGHIQQANRLFQANLQANYHQTKNSSPVKRPRIVSKILDFLSFHYRNEKIALIVVDGMALWQYELLSNKLPGKKQEDVIYSWLPSITQLSRQAIFRGDSPKADYRQAPVGEEKLWKNYWKEKGCKEYEIAYQHGSIDLESTRSITKLAIVFKDLDDKMHGSTDYTDLMMLTRNWIERSGVNGIVGDLLERDFIVFLTSDHGNIQAKGWRGLIGREKLGTNKSGSRSSRHIEYEEEWLTKEFYKANPELKESSILEEGVIYLTGGLSFSGKDSLVTHGGSHLLEVLIPFIEIRK